MKAIILAAGVGKRLTGDLGGAPKCLLVIGGVSLLQRLVRALGRAGVHKVVVVVGYRHEEVEDLMGGSYSGVEVSYVRNPEYRKGAILSLWAARDHFDDDILIMDADVFCPDEMVARLVRSPHRNCFLLDGRVYGSGEEQMLMANGGRVVNIAREVVGDYETIGESVGFFKVAGEAAPDLLAALRQCVEAGRDTIEHEEVYPIFLQQHVVGFELVDDLPWAEIDFPADVSYASDELLPLIDRQP